MELRRYLHLIRRRWILIVVTTLVGALVGLLTTPSGAQYRTNSELYVGSRLLNQNQVQLYALPGLNQIIASFAEMIPSPVIAEKAIQSSGVARSAAQVVGETKAAIVTNTSLITVTVTDPDPVIAQKLANGISDSFVAQVQNYEPTAQTGSVPSEPAYVFQNAALPVVPLPTGEKRKVILGAIFGLVISILLVLLLDYLDITVKSPEELERRLGLPVLAIVPLRRALTSTSSHIPEKVSVG